MSQNIMHGARAQLIVNGRIVGLFTSVSYGLNYDVAPAFVLGRYSPAEITYTGQDAVSISASGYRVVDNGAFVVAGLPKLQELMTFSDMTLSIWDRQTNKKIMTVVGVKPVGFSTALSPRSQSDLSVSFLGLRLSDESAENNETSDASDLLSGT